ncbi:uncharacterized protein LOC115411511 isoform X2 [Xyrichtys novacula]|uniref:Uncharacterized protein LOC115411511 isoform X2 n=1 Tax=Xyrichtys novacula TaxID=13765 RepID=A0AAV1F9J5_XYRNO|nr:uncharacterized protein LOC115411511 isoform X2 [Xyrichtys novacula]
MIPISRRCQEVVKSVVLKQNCTSWKQDLTRAVMESGGSGRRKLTVIPPEEEGYTTKALRAASAGGKATFYIVPLQETLDTYPLPPDSTHFSKLAKTACYQCNELMPLQMLALHIKTCKGKLSDDDGDNDDESSDGTCVVENKCKVVCPICTKEFPDDEITVHARLCGERRCYNFLCMEEIDFHSLSKKDVADVQSLMMYADEIISCGYSSQIKLDSKENIICCGVVKFEFVAIVELKFVAFFELDFVVFVELEFVVFAELEFVAFLEHVFVVFVELELVVFFEAESMAFVDFVAFVNLEFAVFIELEFVLFVELECVAIFKLKFMAFVKVDVVAFVELGFVAFVELELVAFVELQFVVFH